MPRAVIYFKKPDPDRWFKNDRVWRAKIRRAVRGEQNPGGIELVYLNLLKGLDKLGVEYATNIPFDDIRPTDLVGVIGIGKESLEGYNKPNPILAGVIVTEHPSDWPTLFEDYPVARYVVHCDWAKAMYERYYGPRIVTWAVGIDTDDWLPTPDEKTVDFLIYDKIRWDSDRVSAALLEPILATLAKRGLNYEIIKYGSYKPDQFRQALSRCRGMLFLCEHETQGLAYQQAMSCNIPVLAWDPGMWLDPWRYRYGETYVPATSVPFFDSRCGETFCGVPDFLPALMQFQTTLKAAGYAPRDYVLENLTLAGCAEKYLALLEAHSTLAPAQVVTA